MNKAQVIVLEIAILLLIMSWFLGQLRGILEKLGVWET